MLAEERRELMATGGGPSKPPPSPQPRIDNLIPHLEFEIGVKDDSDGINLQNNADGKASKHTYFHYIDYLIFIDSIVEEENVPGPSYINDTKDTEEIQIKSCNDRSTTGILFYTALLFYI